MTRPRQGAFDLDYLPDLAAEEFLVSDCNRNAWTAIRNWQRWPEKRLALTEKIVRVATEEYGIAIDDIVIDPLAMPIGADSTVGGVTLEVIRGIRERWGLNTTCGASNVSFGLPSVLRGHLGNRSGHCLDLRRRRVGGSRVIVRPVRSGTSPSADECRVGGSP